MRRRILSWAGLLVVLLAIALTHGAGRGAVPSPPVSPPRAPLPRAERPTAAPPTLPPPARDVFRYADDEAAPQSSSPARAAAVIPETTPPPPPAVRLIGLVRAEGGLRAALSVMGEVVVSAPGDEVSGYTVVSVDDEGVRVRAPDGTEMSLAIDR